MSGAPIGPQDPGIAAGPQIGPAMIPTQYGVDDVVLDSGAHVVMLTVLTPAGTHVSFSEPATARRLASLLVDAATRAKASGLIIPQVHVDLEGLQNGEGPQ